MYFSVLSQFHLFAKYGLRLGDAFILISLIPPAYAHIHVLHLYVPATAFVDKICLLITEMQLNSFLLRLFSNEMLYSK